MSTKYKVVLFMDNTYEVILLEYGDYHEDDITESSVFQGSLSDCEAYIRLKENGYLN